jgi:hypothetical protein
MNKLPKARGKDIVVQILGKEVLIYDLNTHKAYNLNETASAVYQACDGKTSVSEISFLLGKQLKSPVTEDIVWLALDGLKKDNLLSNSEELTIKFDGLSRREVIRKVGFASLIALPVISSLVAPTAAMAQSNTGAPGCLATGLVCTPNPAGAARCCSGVCRFNIVQGLGRCT